MNEYALQKIAEKQNGDPGWKETNATEMMSYFGLMILIGIHNLPRVEMYWSSDDRLGVPGVNNECTQCMQLTVAGQ